MYTETYDHPHRARCFHVIVSVAWIPAYIQTSAFQPSVLRSPQSYGSSWMASEMFLYDRLNRLNAGQYTGCDQPNGTDRLVTHERCSIWLSCLLKHCKIPFLDKSSRLSEDWRATARWVILRRTGSSIRPKRLYRREGKQMIRPRKTTL